jgi:transcriptional regulator with XRE-family HTH domain
MATGKRVVPRPLPAHSQIRSAADLGAFVAALRTHAGMSRQQAALWCGVSIQFLSDVEHGKPTLQLDRTLQVAMQLGLRLDATCVGRRKTDAEERTPDEP